MRRGLSACALMCLLAGTAWGAAPGKSYDVFIIPSAGVNTLITQTSEQLAECGLTSLARQGFMPHVTLYLADYGPDALPRLQREVAALSRQWQPFPLQLTHLTQTRGDWLMIAVQNSPSLQRLSDSLVQRLSLYRDKSAAMPAWVNAIQRRRRRLPNTVVRTSLHTSIPISPYWRRATMPP
ncbi:Uncharacterised protein [Edwardsiella tarda]|nr:Uncharacterised protein [Edwardsiella tarda]